MLKKTPRYIIQSIIDIFIRSINIFLTISTILQNNDNNNC